HFATVFVLVDHAAVVVYALSLHDALPIFVPLLPRHGGQPSFNGARPQWRPGVGSLRAGCPTQKPAARHRCHGSLLPEPPAMARRSEEHTSELQSRENLVCRLLLEKKNDRE